MATSPSSSSPLRLSLESERNFDQLPWDSSPLRQSIRTLLTNAETQELSNTSLDIADQIAQDWLKISREDADINRWLQGCASNPSRTNCLPTTSSTASSVNAGFVSVAEHGQTIKDQPRDLSIFKDCQLTNLPVTDCATTSDAALDSSPASSFLHTANEGTMVNILSNCIADAPSSDANVALSFDEMKEFRKLVVNTRRREGLAQHHLASILRESNPAYYNITSKTVLRFEGHDYSERRMSLLYPVFKRWTDDRHRRANLPHQTLRGRLSIEQYAILNNEFSKNQRLAVEKEIDLASSTGLSRKTIRNWFTNRRNSAKLRNTRRLKQRAAGSSDTSGNAKQS
ncbi:POU domain, class 5, transcription factor 1.2-like [Sycon ciliatum]|uniref:POU domain, class 5, transcription factor 1.2-like n=1 Tax=Sycon ciliatum TaxID=27933 RepID=UPI0031F6951A